MKKTKRYSTKKNKSGCSCQHSKRFRFNPIEDRIINDPKIIFITYIKFILSKLNKEYNPDSIYEYTELRELKKVAEMFYESAQYMGLNIPEPPNGNSDQEFIQFLQQNSLHQTWAKKLKGLEDTKIISREKVIRGN